MPTSKKRSSKRSSPKRSSPKRSSKRSSLRRSSPKRSSSKRSSSKRSSTKELFDSWSKHAPKKTSDRKELMSNCGKKCFLKPEKMKFPVCRKDCSVDCKGLVASRIRARQWGYPEVDKKVTQYYKKHGCSKKNQKGGLIPGSADENSDLTFRRSTGRLNEDGSIHHVVSHGNENTGFRRSYGTRDLIGDPDGMRYIDQEKDQPQRGGGFFDWFWNLFGMNNMSGGAYVYDVEHDKCPICNVVGPYEDFGGDQVQICSGGHYAHPGCISSWYGVANTCPVCNVNVSDFPLYLRINPGKVIGPRYDPDNYAPTAVSQGNIDDILIYDDYDQAYAFFTSQEGMSYVNEQMREIYENRDEDIYHGNISEDDPIMEDHFILRFMHVLNVANALYDAYGRYPMPWVSTIDGPLIDLYFKDDEDNIRTWLRTHGYRASFEFLDIAANRSQLNSVKWYLNTYKPDPVGNELLRLVQELQEHGEHNDSYAVIMEYIINAFDDNGVRRLRRYNAM